MALPLSGLVLFFEMTQPAHTGTAATQMASLQQVQPSPGSGGAAIARFHGVSAQLRSAQPAQVAQIKIARDAQRVLASAPSESLQPGFYTEIVTKDRRRISLLIVSREFLTDQAIPDNSRLAHISDASSANLMTFVWGSWIYKVEIEDKGVEADAVVPKLL